MARKAPFRDRTKRHLLIAAGRLARSLPGCAPRHRSLFFHFPKCGGTSVSEAMYATIPFQQRIGVLDAVATRRAVSILHFDVDDPHRSHEDFDAGHLTFETRETLLLQHMAWDTMLIHGHVLWSDRAWAHFGQTYRYVSLMRDPVERMVSNFRMTQRAGLVGEDVEAYLASPVARRHAQVYLRYLSGMNTVPEGILDEALRLALARLEHFALIGFLDQMEEFVRSYSDLFGTRLRIPHLNTATGRMVALSATQMDKIARLCTPDQTLYEAARARFSAAR